MRPDLQPKITTEISRQLEFFFAVLLVTMVFLLYRGAINAPWYLDDITAILEWPGLKNMGLALRSLFSPRGLARLSFALNYAFGGLSLPGYHLVNISIHAATAVVAYLILKRLFRESPLFPMLGALLFALHPVQTQSVTYIVQRMTSMSGLFFLLALYLYIHFREEYPELIVPRRFPAYLYWAGSLLAGILAMFSKENAVVLPAALFLYDWYFLDGRTKGVRALILRVLPFTAVPCLAAGYALVTGEIRDTLDTNYYISSSRDMSSLTYFVTQFTVLWEYIRTLTAPYGITLDYGYPVVANIFNPKSLVAGTGLAGLMFLAWRMRLTFPRISFGITWFFLTLSVESSFIPLDPMFIHRLYVPSVGFVIIMLDLLLRIPWRQAVVASICAISCLYAVLTWQRNSLWCDPIAFNEDNLRKAPKSERVRVALADVYKKVNRSADAKTLLLEAQQINPSYAPAITRLANFYLAEGNEQVALRLLEPVVRANPLQKEPHAILGELYIKLGRHSEAEISLLNAVKLDPTYGSAHLNLGIMYAMQGRWREAEKQYRHALILFPDDPWIIHYFLGIALINMGRVPEARAELKKALMSETIDPISVYGMATTWFKMGEHQEVRLWLDRLRVINPPLAEKFASETQFK